MFLNTSRLPLKSPKTFENFDFTRIHGKDSEKLKSIPSLAAIYAHRNLAFIGSPGIGKTHLAMAFGRSCCENRMKAYFLKASELNQRLTEAVKYDRVGSTVNGLVRPECLIIDEIGRCIFNENNTRLFFDVIDRRYSREGTNNIIFTSNTGPDKWKEYFTGDSTLLCSLDRIFDNATVFMMKGDSFRGRNCETVAIEAGSIKIPETK